MKYVVLLGDGMADEPMEELGGLTPLQKAQTPNMDRLARSGEIGLAVTVPEGFHPGSDVANLSVFGYDPRQCYSGRSPLEAASMGVQLGPEDVAFRLNLVHLVPHYGRLYMGDFSAGHIETGQARQLIEALQEEFGDDEFQFYPGVSYRHLMVWRGGRDDLTFFPPHDITNQSVLEYMPRGNGAEQLIELMNSSQLLFKNHPVNLRRAEQDQLEANSIWLWGQGRRPVMEPYAAKYGLQGTVISAVDLIKGIGVCAGLEVVNVPGATGYLDTNYQGKAEAALQALESQDFVYLHVEAPDEAAHGGKLEEKIQAIEDFDAKVVGPVLDGLGKLGPHRVLVMPDHPTPVSKMTHTSAPVPYILFDSAGGYRNPSPAQDYSEVSAKSSGQLIDPGHGLLARMLGR